MQLKNFLGSLRGEYRDRPPLFSADKAWIGEMAQMASRAANKLNSLYPNWDDDSTVPKDQIIQILSALKDAFHRYELYGLAVGTSENYEVLKAFVEYAAYSSEHHALFLIPDYPSPQRPLGFSTHYHFREKFLLARSSGPAYYFGQEAENLHLRHLLLTLHIAYTMI
jgi:hypothetical protein